MEILDIVKYVAFEEIFSKYSLPAVNQTDNSIKDFGKWTNEIQIDDVNWRYRRDSLNVFKDNSLNDLIECFKAPLFNYYLEQVRAFQERQEEQANNFTEADEAEASEDTNINLDACPPTESESESESKSSESSDPNLNS